MALNTVPMKGPVKVRMRIAETLLHPSCWIDSSKLALIIAHYTRWPWEHAQGVRYASASSIDSVSLSRQCFSVRGRNFASVQGTERVPSSFVLPSWISFSSLSWRACSWRRLLVVSYNINFLNSFLLFVLYSPIKKHSKWSLCSNRAEALVR